MEMKKYLNFAERNKWELIDCNTVTLEDYYIYLTPSGNIIKVSQMKDNDDVFITQMNQAVERHK